MKKKLIFLTSILLIFLSSNNYCKGEQSQKNNTTLLITPEWKFIKVPSCNEKITIKEEAKNNDNYNTNKKRAIKTARKDGKIISLHTTQ